MDKRAVDRGRVGERAKEALGEWLGWLEWLVDDASLGVVFLFLMECACGTVGMEGEVCPGEGS